jgi:xylose isomerase
MQTGKDRRVTTEYVPTREHRFSFGIWTVGWQGVDDAGVWASAAACMRNYLDQLALEYLYGVR